MTTTETIERSNATLRDAVETRLAGRTMSPMVASLAGCRPAMEAAAAALADPRDIDATDEESSTYSQWTPPDYATATHPSSQAFFDLCDSLKAMHRAKSQDYGSAEDPLANIRAGADFVGIEPWRAAMVRLSDKVTRLATYCRTGKLEHEGVEDTLLDLASYALLCLVTHRESRSA